MEVPYPHVTPSVSRGTMLRGGALPVVDLKSRAPTRPGPSTRRFHKTPFTVAR